MIRKSLTLNDRTYSYFDEGHGKTILLLHGWCDEASDYAPLIKKLKTKFRVITPDLPNFGDSQNSEPFLIETYVTFLNQFLKSIEITNPLIIGHSFGGKIALHYAKQKVVSHIILINSAGMKIENGLILTGAGVMKNTFDELFEDFIETRKIHWNYVKNFLRNVYKYQFWKLLFETLFVTIEFNQDITSSITLLWANGDEIFPRNHAEMFNKRFSNSKLIYLRGGHYALILNADEYSTIIKSMF